MKRTYIKDVKNFVGEDVLIKASVDTLRDQNKIVFIVLRDVSGKIQSVVLKDCEDFEVAKTISEESVVALTGLVKEEAQAPGGYEIEAKKIEILSKSNPELPIPVNTKKGGEETNANARLDYRFIDLRKAEKMAIFKLWTEMERGWRKYYEEAGYTQIYTPSFMSTSSESGAEVFEVKYFDKKAYLAQSPQFYKQMAISAGLDRVFMVGPVFRAEESFTTRHVTEFTGWDFEIGFIESHHDLMDEEEKMIVAGFKQIKENMGDYLKEQEIELEIPETPFPRISLSEAKEKLKSAGIKSEKDGDLSPEEERKISEIIKEETGSEFVFITDYPIDVRPFYHMRHEDNPKLTKSADLLYKGIEVTTLAQREHRPEILIEQAKEKNMDLDSLEDYFNFFRYGCPPHGGAGIGPGRFIAKILGYENIREVIFLPRDVNRLKP
jgi:nondiscriminating aspartyl-tRNA synthetase